VPGRHGTKEQSSRKPETACRRRRCGAQAGLVVLWLYGWRTGRSELHTCRPVTAAANGANGVQPPLAMPVQSPPA
jgi:hypothetical protein